MIICLGRHLMQYTTINNRVEAIKNNEEDINCLVEEYKPFIASCVQKLTGRYMRYGEDDELSIALMAFVEAVRAFDTDKGSFLSLAQNVIKRRIIDYYRKEKKHENVISLHEYSAEEDEENDMSSGQALDTYSKEEISEYRRLELEDLKRELKEWDISFMELVDASPKQDKTRKIYRDIIKFIISQPDLIKQIKSKRYLPIAEVEKNTGIPRKTIERSRKYIIAALVIITGDYQYIRGYVDWG
jgi:RNA polymerase sigma factor